MRIASCFIGLPARGTGNAHTRSAEKSAHDERLAAQDQQRAFCCGLEKINRQANEMPLGWHSDDSVRVFGTFLAQ